MERFTGEVAVNQAVKSGSGVDRVKSSDSAGVHLRVSPRLVGKKRPVYAVHASPKKNTRGRRKQVVAEPQREHAESISLSNVHNEAFSPLVGEDPSEKPKSTCLQTEDFSANKCNGEIAEVNGVLQHNMSATARVKDTLRIFNAFFLHFVQAEEKRCKKEDEDVDTGGGKTKTSRLPSKNKSSKLKKNKALINGHAKKISAKRPDLKAISKMLETKNILYPKKIGNLDGIEVGHQFFSRAEMVVLGMHRHWLCGIDYIGTSYDKEAKYKGLKLPLATSIVLSGMYEDDVDNSEDVVYTGQGGHDLLGSKRQIGDQIMERGNLALKHSMEEGLPVRVTRGHESANSYCGKVYTYDGLYKVVDYWAEKGLSGFTVYKFRLRRIDGQPILTTSQVHFTRAQPPKCLSDLRGLVCKDITGNQEKIPIPATNVVDDPPLPPSGYLYSNVVHISKNVPLPPEAKGCTCKGLCVDSSKCACAKLNGGDFPYVRRDGGRLVVAKDVVYECGPHCGCGVDCINRVSQQGIRYRLEVFRTAKKGWAVRSWDSIPSGAPVCEYIGVLMRTDDIDDASDNKFIFEIDCLQTMKGIDGRQRRFGDVSKHVTPSDYVEEKKAENLPEYCLDAGSVGNVARFINHSCEPNLFVQCVLSSHHDMKLAKVMLFAADNIPPLQELTYDYNYLLDSVVGPDGNVQKMMCYCGASGCRKRLY